jgi:hypothetical protein
MLLDLRAYSWCRIGLFALIFGCNSSLPVVDACTSLDDVTCSAQSVAGMSASTAGSGGAGETSAAGAMSTAVPDASQSDGSRPTPTMEDGEPGADDDAGAPDPPVIAPSDRDPNALVGKTTPLAVMAGMYAKGHENELYGTDLGWAFKHEGKLWVLFGDSWRTSQVVVTLFADDSFAQISLDDYPNGDAVDAWVRAHPAAAGTPAWRAAGPEMDVAVMSGAGSAFAPTTVWRDGTQLYTGPAQTPMAGFSNARSDSGSGAFGVFFRYAHVECNAGACPNGFECDTGLGREPLEVFSPPCVVGGASATCLAGAGFCQDRSSSMYDAKTELGRTKSVVVRQEVGSALSSNPLRFDTQAWDTHRFFNLTARTIEDFDPARPSGEGNDYRTAEGAAPERDGVFMWGRPHFAGIGSEGRDAELYFAWVPMPVRDASAHFEWKPRFFAGLEPDGTPRFVEREVDSVPLDLDAAKSGEQPDEPLDVVGQMSISWLPGLKRWVMFYGGDIAESFFGSIFRADAMKIRHDPRGALYARFAEQPWGPWTRPRPVLTAGDRNHDAEAVDQYAPGGLLYHDRCKDPSCAGNDMSQLGNTGVLYASSIVEPWTITRPDSTDLYWLLSTWNPYQVVLAKTTLTPGDITRD